MTTKKTIKKLTLNKTTISNLDNLSMRFVHGGDVIARDVDDPKPVIPIPTYCDNCDASRETRCAHSCFYYCATSRLCIYDTAGVEV